MKKYFRKIEKVKVGKNHGKKIFFAELIKNPHKNISNEKRTELLKEVQFLSKKGWGDFDNLYLKKGILKSFLLCLLRDENNSLVGMTAIKKNKIFNRDVYSIGLSVVDPDFRGLDLLTRMAVILIKRIFMESVFRGNFTIEVIFITPNIRTMGAIAREADFIYPNPYDFNEKKQSIDEADEETWKTVKEYLRVTKEEYRRLDREGCVMEGFYDTRPHLIVKENEHLDKKLNSFGRKYLYSSPGKEIVVRAKIGLGALIRNVTSL